MYLQNHGMTPVALHILSLHLWRGYSLAQETRLVLWRCQGSQSPLVNQPEKSVQERLGTIQSCKEAETSHTPPRLWTLETELSRWTAQAICLGQARRQVIATWESKKPLLLSLRESQVDEGGKAR